MAALCWTFIGLAVLCYAREKSKRGHAAVLRGTLFLDRTATLTGSIFEQAELHSRIHF